MPAPSIEHGDVTHTGTHTFSGAVNFNPDAIDHESIAEGLEAHKIVRHQSVDVELFGPATTVAALTKLIHIVKGQAGTLVQLTAAVVTAATGADRTVNVDLKKSTGGGAFATVLTATILFNNTSVALTPESVSGFTSDELAADDILELVVTVAGAAGNQAIGLIVTLTFEEEYA